MDGPPEVWHFGSELPVSELVTGGSGQAYHRVESTPRVHDNPHIPDTSVGRFQEGEGHLGGRRPQLGRFPVLRDCEGHEAGCKGAGRRPADPGLRAPGRRRRPVAGRHDAEGGGVEDVPPLQGQGGLSGHRDGRTLQGRPGDRRDGPQARGHGDPHGGHRPDTPGADGRTRRGSRPRDVQRKLLRRACSPRSTGTYRSSTCASPPGRSGTGEGSSPWRSSWASPAPRR